MIAITFESESKFRSYNKAFPLDPQKILFSSWSVSIAGSIDEEEEKIKREFLFVIVFVVWHECFD